MRTLRSGKINIAVNIAAELKKQGGNVAIADLDIVNPYFRAKDSVEEFKKLGIRLICSEYANTNLDIPALPQEMYAVTDDRTLKVVLDIGGDDRGALVLGRLAPAITAENDYEMLMVVNCFRPLTRDAESTIEVMREIETAGKIKFTGLVNNSNLGAETTEADVLSSVSYAENVSELSGLPIFMTTVEKSLFERLSPKIENLFPLDLQRYIFTPQGDNQ